MPSHGITTYEQNLLTYGERVSLQIVRGNPTDKLAAYDSFMAAYRTDPDLRRAVDIKGRRSFLKEALRTYGQATEAQSIRDQQQQAPSTDGKSSQLAPADVQRIVAATGGLYRANHDD